MPFLSLYLQAKREVTMKSITLYVDNHTYLTGLHPYTKLFYVLTAIAVPLLCGRLWVFGAFIAASILMLISAKLLRKAVPLIIFSFTILITIFLIHGLFYTRNENPLFRIGPLQFYQEGVLYAVRIGLNILNMLLSFATFVLSTKPSDLVEELEKSGFSKRFGYIINSVFQIIPQMTGTMNTIMDAQRSRGMNTEGNLIVRAKAFIPLISPVIMSSLINTRERAVALEVRGFDSKEKKTFLYDRPKKKADITLILFFALLIIIATVWRITLWLP